MKKIQIYENKTLKLQNVLINEVDIEQQELFQLDTEIEKMNTYIKTHGIKQIGPLIQHTSIYRSKANEMTFKISFMLQCDNYLHKVSKPYKMESTIRVKNCLYAKYIGPEDKIKYAYDKMGVYAFENDIELDGSNYTIYVSSNKEDETMLTDIFMPIKE